MGDINEDLLKTAGMDYAVITPENHRNVLQQAVGKISEGLPFTLLVKKGVFDERH